MTRALGQKGRRTMSAGAGSAVAERVEAQTVAVEIQNVPVVPVPPPVESVSPTPRLGPVKVKTPNRVERQENLRKRITGLVMELRIAGLDGYLRVPGAINPIAPALPDLKTRGMIAHAEEALGSYIQRVSIMDNFAQRQPFDHLRDPIYMRLIRDFIEGAAMPESKVGALGAGVGVRVVELTQPGIRYSVIDGLQRLYCYLIATLLVYRREGLVEDRCITADAWEYFREAVEGMGGRDAAMKELLLRPVRYEIFYQIDLAGLLHYLVTFNTGQRRMGLDVQLEIMQKPLIEELQLSAGIAIWHETQNVPGRSKPKEQFSAADLIVAARAFILANPQVSKAGEAEDLLEGGGYLDLGSTFDVGDINDVVHTLKRITTDVQARVIAVYADPVNAYVLSNGGMFLLAFAAACGKVRADAGGAALEAAMLQLQGLISSGAEDPLHLKQYQETLALITSSRGKAIRRLVFDTFLRFFSGTTRGLEWGETFRLMS